MSLMKRISLIFRSKANKALDKAEDPRETLDYSYQRQLELLSKVRRGVADVATSRKRVQLQVNQIEQQAAKLQGQAEKAIAARDAPAPPRPPPRCRGAAGAAGEPARRPPPARACSTCCRPPRRCCSWPRWSTRR